MLHNEEHCYSKKSI